MKKLLTVLLSIIMTVSVLGGTTLTSVSAAETIEISNVADLMYKPTVRTQTSIS